MTNTTRSKILTGSIMSVACIFCHACTAFNVNTNIPPRYCVARNSGGGTFTPWAVSRSLSSCSQRPPLPSSRGAAGRLRCIRRRRSGESLNMFDETDLFQLQQWAGEVSAQELTHVSPLTVGVMYGTGLLMSLSPCALSLLPLTISYIAGTEGEVDATGTDGSARVKGGGGSGFDSIKSGFVPSAAFAAGLATVLSLLGLSATLAGRVMGSDAGGGVIGATLLPLGASAFAVAMGLNLLELVKVDLPSFEGGMEYMMSLPRNARAYLLGASSAFVASPCCTPVLASILGFIATSKDPVLGLLLLLTYSAGYTTPLMVAGTASGALSALMSAKGFNWITPVSGGMLISYGTYSGLDTLFDQMM